MKHRLPYVLWRVRAWATPLTDLAFALALVALCYGATELLANVFA